MKITRKPFLKKIIVWLAIHKFLPASFATWLIQKLGLRSS